MKRLDLRALDILSNEYEKKHAFPDYQPKSFEEIQEILKSVDKEDE